MKSGSLKEHGMGKNTGQTHGDLNQSESQYSEPPGQISYFLCILQVELDGLSASCD